MYIFLVKCENFIKKDQRLHLTNTIKHNPSKIKDKQKQIRLPININPKHEYH